MSGTIARGWLNENSYRAFPFVENSSPSCTDGSRMPDWLVLDMKAVVSVANPNASLDGVGFRATGFSVERSDGFIVSSVRLSVSYGPSAERSAMSVSAEVPVGGNAHVSAYDERPDGSFSMVSAFLGAPASTGDAVFGSFDLARPREVIPSRIVVNSGGFGIDALAGNFGVASGDVHLRDGHNTHARISSDGAVEITVSPTAGEGYECPDPGGSKCDSIRFINGQRADTNGSFTIFPGAGTRVETGTFEGLPAVFVRTSEIVDAYAKRG